MVTIKNYSKIYDGSKKAVDDLSITINDGDLFGFIGSNGAGKTTTLKAIVGILPFEIGTIEINGIDIQKDPIACKRQTAFIPDNPDLYDQLTGLQYINFVADVFNIPKDERKSLTEYYAKEFDMLGELNNPIQSYSHGMKQKVALISAFVHNPKLLVLDEPFVGLDPRAAFTVKNIMQEFCAKGNSIIFSTHVLEVAQKICNKVAIIKQGKLITCGDMGEITKDNSLESVFMELTEDEQK